MAGDAGALVDAGGVGGGVEIAFAGTTFAAVGDGCDGSEVDAALDGAISTGLTISIVFGIAARVAAGRGVTAGIGGGLDFGAGAVGAFACGNTGGGIAVVCVRAG